MRCVPSVGAASPSPAAVHVGRREHYRLARDMVDRGPQRAVLMQRSSTLLLGPEAGWVHESEFHDAVWRSVAGGTRWFHVASLGGIERHLRRIGSTFPLAAASSPRTSGPYIVSVGGIVTIRGAGSTGADGVDATDQPVKVLPDEGTTLGADFCVDDFKFDRQVRMVAADFGTHSEALVVSDVGDQQVTIHLDGDPASALVDVCIDFYGRCPSLTTDDLDRCLDRARRAVPA